MFSFTSLDLVPTQLQPSSQPPFSVFSTFPASELTLQWRWHTAESFRAFLRHSTVGKVACGLTGTIAFQRDVRGFWGGTLFIGIMVGGAPPVRGTLPSRVPARPPPPSPILAGGVGGGTPAPLVAILTLVCIALCLWARWRKRRLRQAAGRRSVCLPPSRRRFAPRDSGVTVTGNGMGADGWAGEGEGEGDRGLVALKEQQLADCTDLQRVEVARPGSPAPQGNGTLLEPQDRDRPRPPRLQIQ